ncbi:M10 family metallopeptidase [Chachezhania sediminis]|uniref:M10 family metallopeptidase n=1 Tax=Chachezhania sediminis TaxID=2599291 RepID=UPI00131BC16D|nr:M10 family metallopeptidase [Chachezhania sediminis]
MVTKTEIPQAMQFDFFHDKQPMNTTGATPYTISYRFAGLSEPSNFPSAATYSGWTPLTEAEKTAFRQALAQIAAVANVSFVETPDNADPVLDVGKVLLPGSTTGFGGPSISFFGDQIRSYDGYVVYDTEEDLASGTVDVRNLLLHELGHALGLKHPFSGDHTLPAAEETNKFTLMSYTDNPDNGERSDGLEIYDIYALQSIWGAAAHNGGDTVYTGPGNDTVFAVWDSGGTDTFSANGRSGAVLLDLREGRFSTFDATDDVAIAFDTRIENAIGGSGDDRLIGNGLDNRMSGKGGNDVLKGGGGGDKLLGGAGRDTLLGNGGTDKLLGGGSRDKLKGGAGADVLNGQKGNDVLIGGGGGDMFLFARNGGRDRIKDFQDDVDTIRISKLGGLDAVLDKARQVDDDVHFDFGGNGALIVLGTTIAQVGDDILA